MPIPSFDELLAEARRIGQEKSESEGFNRSELIAKSTSEFVKNILGTPAFGEKRETFGGRVNVGTGEVESFDKPTMTGRTLLEKMFGVQGLKREKGYLPVTSDQATEFVFKKSLEGIKQTGRMAVADKINSYRTKLAGIQSSKESADKRIEAIKTGLASIQKDIDNSIFTGQDVTFYTDLKNDWIKELDRLSGSGGGGGVFKPKKVKTDFATEAEADAAGLPLGTEITIGGRRARIR